MADELSKPDYERAIALLSNPPEWLVKVLYENFPSPFEQDGDDDEPFKRMLRAVAEAALETRRASQERS